MASRLSPRSGGATGVTTFIGGIANSGTISAGIDGIHIFDTSIFSGAISIGGSGRIVAHSAAIVVDETATFSGGIVNSGTLSGKTGISISASTISGAIVDSGIIVGTSRGIAIGSHSEIVASGATAIDIAGRTFSGGIANFGTLSGLNGIKFTAVSGVTVVDGGAILASGGTAIQFVGSGDALTLKPAIRSRAPSIPRAATPCTRRYGHG